mgnify:CR=1 FL=1
MKKANKLSILYAAVLLLAALTGNALATDVPTSAVVVERVFNDSFASILTINNNYPALISIDDQCAGPLGWANLHVWRFSLDGVTETPLKNTTASIQGVRTDGNLLFLVAWDDVWTVDKFTGNTLDEADYFYSMRGLSISRSGNRLFGAQ